MISDNIIVLMILSSIAMMIMAFSVIFFDRRFRTQRLKAKEAELLHQKELLRAVITSQETERQRIGQDLHDDIGSSLSALKLVFEMGDTSHFQLTDVKGECIERINTIIKALRHISHNLSPYLLNLHGFNTALESLLRSFEADSQLKIKYHNDAERELLSMPIEVTTAFYRVVEELLNNTLKHANASQINIDLVFENDTLTISYRDNGRGFDPANISHGLGLRNIESRLAMIGSTFELSSQSGGFGIKIYYNHDMQRAKAS